MLENSMEHYTDEEHDEFWGDDFDETQEELEFYEGLE